MRRFLLISKTARTTPFAILARILRHVVLGVAVAAASMPIVERQANAGDQPVAKAGLAAADTATLPAVAAPDEEMVMGFIVKPQRRAAGRRFRNELEARDATELNRVAKVELRVARAMSDDAHVLRLRRPMKLSEARVVAARMMRSSGIESAEPDRVMYPAATTPADPGYAGYPGQWHYMAPAGSNKGGANLPNAWDITLGSTSINVAVLDTGFLQHPDLAAVLPGYDFISSGTTANDGGGRDANAADPGDWLAANECGNGNAAGNSSWHGTHVAGTIAALMNNGIGGTGVAPNVRILPVRVLGKCGGAISDIIDAMRWAAGIAVPGAPANPYPAHVINMSLGGAGNCSAAFQSAVTDVINAGKVIVAAAGNDASSTVSQPANCTGVIAVTAHTLNGDNANYANVGSQVTISAPGGGCGTMSSPATCTAFSSSGPGIYSLGNTGTTTPTFNGYSLKTGTSMAVPHVSGVVALMLSMNPALSPAEIMSYLRASARPHPAGTACTLAANAGKCGAGLLDAEAALTMVAPAVTLANPAQVVRPGRYVAMSASASAPIGRTIVSYAWAPLASNPSVVALDNANSASAAFTAPAIGTYAFTVTVTDSAGKSATANATVRVNTAPVLTAIGGQSVAAGSELDFTVGAIDVDGDAPIFHAISLPPGASMNADGTFIWPSAVPAGSYTVSYYASDSYDNSTEGAVVVNAAPGKGGGGGSMDSGSLIALAVLAACLRLRRAIAAHPRR